MSQASPYQGSAPRRPKGKWWKSDNLCQWGEGFVSPGCMIYTEVTLTLTLKIRAPLIRTAGIPINREVLSSLSNENNQVHIRKTIHIRLLENQ
ncbi:hypothetical protein H920_16934 [Fukomys damarensis]|uniref:Uncharacterized protein n=1 Tax=Fukomys damarensis TaxID=885580 RepID=A0A091DFY3_FUKDA|nr:hypothetical protein H920_16934 [Fukomys damarensis]